MRSTGGIGAHPMLRALFRDSRTRIALVVLLLVALGAILAPVLAPYDPAAQLDIERLNSQPPSAAHPFGTDPYSRDVLSRLIYGSRVSLAVGLGSVALAMSFGIAVGIVAGYRRRRRRCRAHAPRRCGDLRPAPARAHHGRVALGTARTRPAHAAAWRARDGSPSAGWCAPRRSPFATGSSFSRRVPSACPRRGCWSATCYRTWSRPRSSPRRSASRNVILLEAGLSYLGIGVRPPTASWGTIIQDGAERVAELLVAHALSGAGDPRDGVRVQRAGRRLAGCVRPPAASPRRRPTRSSPQRHDDAPARDREPPHLLLHRHGVARAVDGVSFSRRRGRDGRHRRRVGLRQVASPRSRSSASSARPDASRPAARSRFEGRDLLDARRARDAARPRQPHRDGLPGADDRAQSGLHRRRPDRRGRARPRRRRRKRDAWERAVEMLDARRHPRPASSARTSIRTSSPAACASAS